MTEQANVGRLSLDVVSEVQGLRARLQKQLRAELAGTKATIKAEIDAGGLKTQLREAVRSTQTGAGAVKLRIQLDSADLRRQVRDALATAQAGARGINTTLNVGVDTARMRAQLARAARDSRTTVDVDADTRAAHEQLEALHRDAEGKPIRKRVEADTRGAAAALTSFGRLASMATFGMAALESAGSGIVQLVGGLGQVAMGLGAIAASASQAASAAALIPAGIVGGIQLIGTLVAGFAGIGDAVSALQKAEQQASRDAQTAARAREAATSRVRAAQDRLGDAQQRVADVAEAGARRVADAQRAVADAHKATVRAMRDAADTAEDGNRRIAEAQEGVADAAQARVDAQESGLRRVRDAEEQVAGAQASARRAQLALNDARAAARERLEDLRLSLKGAALDEEAAQLAVERARQNMLLAHEDPRRSDLDKREADLAYKEALQRQEEVRESNADLRAEAADAMRRGVEGAQNVVAAQADIVEANRDVARSQEDLNLTRREAARDDAEAAERLADARQSEARARADAARDNAAAAEKVADARESEARAAQDLARTRTDAARANADAAKDVARHQLALTEAQQALTEATQRTSASALAAQAAMAQLSPAGQRFARFVKNDLLPAVKEIRAVAQEALLPGAQAALTQLMTLAGPIKTIVGDTGRVIGDLMVRAAELVTTPAWQRDLLTIGRGNATALGLFGQAALNLLTPLRDILVVVAKPGGLLARFSEWTVALSENINQTIGAKRRNGELFRTLDRAGDTIAQWYRIVRNILRGIRNIAREAAPAGDALTVSLENATLRFVEWTEDHKDDLRVFFANAVPVVESFGRILLGVANILGDMMSSPRTLEMMDAIETRLVPALDRLVNALMESDTGIALVGILSDLADIVTNLIESGAFGWFVDMLGVLVGAIKDISGNPIGQAMFAGLFALAGIVGPLALIAGIILKIQRGMSKIAKVTGLRKVVDVVYRNRGGGGAGGGGKGGGGGAGGGGAGGGGTGPVVAGGGSRSRRNRGGSRRTPPQQPRRRRRVPGGGRIGGGLIAGGITAALGGGTTEVLGSIALETLLGGLGGGGGRAARGAGGAGRGGIIRRAGGGVGGLMRRAGGGIRGLFTRGGAAGAARGAGRVAGRGGILGMATGLAARPLGRLIRGRNPASSVRGALGGAASGALTGAGIGATVGSIIPGIGTAIGGAVGGATGAIIGAVRAIGWAKVKGAIATAAKGMWGGITTAAKAVGPPVGRFFTGLPGQLARPFKATGRWISDQWRSVKNATTGWFTRTGTDIAGWFAGLPGKLSRTASGVRSWFSRRWAEVRDDVGTRLRQARDKVSNFFRDLPANVAQRVTAVRQWFQRRWAEIRDDVGSRMTGARDRVVNTIRDLPKNLRQKFTDLRTWWDGKWAGIRDVVPRKLGEARDKIDGLMGSMRAKFSTGVTNIKTAWGRLEQAAKKPVQFVVDTVYNNGIRKVWNNIAGLTGLDKLGVIKFAKGGVVPGYAPGRDTELAAVSPGEGWLVPEAVRGLARMMGTSRERAINTFNSQFTNRNVGPTVGPLPGFATGGVVQKFAGGGVVDWLRDKGSSIAKTLRGVGSLAKEGVQNALGSAKAVWGNLQNYAGKALQSVTTPIKQVLTGTPFTSALGTMATKAVKAVVNKAHKEDQGWGGGTGGGAEFAGGSFGRAGHWPRAIRGRVAANTQAAVAYVRKAFGINNIGTLGSRPNKSDHPMGKALDVMIPGWNKGSGRAKGSQIASWFVKNSNRFGTKYVIYYDRINSGSGWRPYTHPLGPNNNPTLQHRDHVHVSLLGEGGTVQPRKGGTLALLAEQGRAETVVDTGLMNRRMADLEQVSKLLQSGGGRGPLIGELHLSVGEGATVQEGLGEVMWWLRQQDRGGVYTR